MTGNDPTRSTSSEEEPVLSPRQEPGTPQQAEDPGYLTETGQAVGEDGSVAPIVGYIANRLQRRRCLDR